MPDERSSAIAASACDLGSDPKQSGAASVQPENGSWWGMALLEGRPAPPASSIHAHGRVLSFLLAARALPPSLPAPRPATPPVCRRSSALLWAWWASPSTSQCTCWPQPSTTPRGASAGGGGCAGVGLERRRLDSKRLQGQGWGCQRGVAAGVAAAARALRGHSRGTDGGCCGAKTHVAAAHAARPCSRRSWLLAHTHVVVGWMFNITFSLALVYASTWLVVNVAPEVGGAAAGGGGWRWRLVAGRATLAQRQSECIG